MDFGVKAPVELSLISPAAQGVLSIQAPALASWQGRGHFAWLLYVSVTLVYCRLLSLVPQDLQ